MADDVQREATEPLRADDAFVELVNVSAVEAELVAAQLRGVGIPVEVFAIGTAGELVALQFSEGSRIMVRRRDLADARAAIADLPVTGAAPTPTDDAELAAQAEAATDRSDPDSGAVV